MEEQDLILSTAPSWAQRLADLALDCSGAFACEEARHLRALLAVIAEAPLGSQLGGIAASETARCARFLGAGAGESAMLALLGEHCGYMLSRGSVGEAMATVVLPGGGETTANGDSLALAMAAALAQALSDANMAPNRAAARTERPALRFN